MVAALAVLLSGCGSWDVVREERVMPINGLVHHEFPRALQAMDVDRAVKCFASETQQAARSDADGLLAGFAKVEHASCKIETVDDVEDGVVSVPVILRMEGMGKSGAKRSITEFRTYTCTQDDEGWSITGWSNKTKTDLSARGPVFADESAERGVTFTQKSRKLLDRFGQFHDYVPGTGLSVRDVDNNGYEDLLLVSGDELRLYANHEGKFTDVTEKLGLATPKVGECRFGIFGDIDNDGDADLFVGVVGGPSYIYRMVDGRYEVLASDKLGVTSASEATSACFADFDEDGDLDLYVGNGGNLLDKLPAPIWDAKNATANQLFVNNGDGTFVDGTEHAGIGDTGWTLAVSSVDFDSDGDLDIYVANDFSYDVLYENQGDATFVDVTHERGFVHRGSSMGLATGDIDADGDFDIFISGMESQSRWIIDQPHFPAPAIWPISFLFRSYVLGSMKMALHGNRFYLNNGDGWFDEISTESGTPHSGWAWGGVFLDYDNDAKQDIYVVNGFYSGQEKDDL